MHLPKVADGGIKYVHTRYIGLVKAGKLTKVNKSNESTSTGYIVHKSAKS